MHVNLYICIVCIIVLYFTIVQFVHYVYHMHRGCGLACKVLRHQTCVCGGQQKWNRRHEADSVGF